MGAVWVSFRPADRHRRGMTAHQPSTATLTDVDDMVIVHRAFRRELSLIPAPRPRRPRRRYEARGCCRRPRPARVFRACNCTTRVRTSCCGRSSCSATLWMLSWSTAWKPSTTSSKSWWTDSVRLITVLGGRGRAPRRPRRSPRRFRPSGRGLLEHLDDEEANILPIAARTITQEEWDELGEHGTSQTSLSQLPSCSAWNSKTSTRRNGRPMMADPVCSGSSLLDAHLRRLA